VTAAVTIVTVGREISGKWRDFLRLAEVVISVEVGAVEHTATPFLRV
jgi:hypothetical protein